jgi:hypothetical protein
MGIITVQGPISGKPYSINISGDTPTETEQARIDQYISQSEASFEQMREQMFGLPAPEEAPIEDIDRTAFGRGFAAQPFQRQRSFGVAEEALADTGLGRLLGFDAEEARAKQEAAEAELARLEQEDPSVGFRDIKGPSTAASFAGEQIGSEARDIAIQTGATGAGALFGPIGAGVGRALGTGYTTAMAAPELFAEAIEKQKEAGGDISLPKALGATAGNMLTEFLADYFIVGKLLKPVDAGAFKRGLLEGGQSAGVEGTQEVSQTVVNRLQAGLPLDSEEALMEYAEAFAGGTAVGGPLGGAAAVIAGRDTSSLQELSDDLAEMGEDGRLRRDYVSSFVNEAGKEMTPEAAPEAAAEEDTTVRQITAEQADKPLALPSMPDQYEDRTFNRAEYERVANLVRQDIESGANINVARIKRSANKEGISGLKADDILSELQAEGKIVSNPSATSNIKFVAPESVSEQETVRRDYRALRRTINKATRDIKKKEREAESIRANLESYRLYGRDLETGRMPKDETQIRTKETELNKRLAEVEASIEQNKSIIAVSQENLKNLGQDSYVPDIEKVGLPNNLRQAEIPEATREKLQERYEARQQSIRGMKTQLAAVNKQARKLNADAKKRQLSSIELDRMNKLQDQANFLEAEISDAQKDSRTPDQIIRELKNEQFLEQERQRDIARKTETARVKAMTDRIAAKQQAKEQEAQAASDANEQAVRDRAAPFTERQMKVFEGLRARLKSMGLSDIRLRGTQGFIDDQAEGAYNSLYRMISVSLGTYDPSLSDADYLKKVSEVIDHEAIHALRDLGVMTKDEFRTLSNAASKIKYEKATADGGTQRRKYTYLDRAKALNPELNADELKEEAVAEMYRDYVAGRLRLAGRPRSIMERIKNFFKVFNRELTDSGYKSIEDIFGTIQSGEMGSRARPQTPVTDPTTKLSRIPRSSSMANLQSFIKDNPEGYTISPETFEFVEGGYVVAPVKEAEIITGQDLPEEVLIDYIRENKEIARILNRPVYLGGWFNTDDQQYYLDSAIITPTKEEALYIANGAEQIAIFDLNNFEEINTNDGIRELQQSGAYSGDTAIGYRIRSKEIGRRFEEARLQRQAREKEQLIGQSDKPLYSRVIPLTDEQRAASILDYLDPDTGQPRYKNKAGSFTLVEFANKLLGLRGAKQYNISNPKDLEDVAQIMAAEAEAALLSSSDAIGWYDEKLKLAKKILYPVYPEVSPTKPDGSENPDYDPAAEHAFDFATAITSNGLSVIDNYMMAARQYDAWKASGTNTFPVEGSGSQGKSMLKAFEFWNMLADRGYDSNQISELLMRQMPRGDLNKMLMEIFGVSRVKDLPITAGGSELAKETVALAYVLGPKIGNGFYQNLRGNYDPLTMDRWWMRFFNRVTGNPIATYDPKTLEKNREDLWKLISNPKLLSETDKKLLQAIKEKVGIKGKIEKSDIELIAVETESVWDKEFYNRAFNDKLEELTGRYDFTVKNGTVQGKDAAKVKRIATAARPSSTPLALAGKLLGKKVVTSLQEDPRNATDRSLMRAAANRAREIMSNDLGVEMSNADFQALMWYAEKRIFEAGGVRKGRGDDNDYADGAIAIVRSRGITDDKIQAALPDTERYRLAADRDELDADAGVGVEADQLRQEPTEGNFFEPRELTILEPDQAQQENLSREDLIDTEIALEGVEVDPQPPRQMYSRVIPTEALMPVQAPVRLKDGSVTPVYGYFMRDGKLRPIVLPKGSHRTYESGVEVGQGLFHIQQRKHDKELVENSKYKRVENAIYDLLRRWQNQGYDDGDDVIAYPSQGGMVLEWRNNLAFSAPPMRLVLEYGSELPNAPAKNAYYVKTFFPVLDKKDRAKPVQRGPMAGNYGRAEARKFSRVLNSQSTPGIGPMDLERRMRDLRYTGTQDAISSVFSKLGKPFGVEEEAVKKSVDYVFDKLQDQFAPVGQVYDKLRKNGADIARDMDAYFQELAMHGVTGDKKRRFNEQEYKPAIEKIVQLNLSGTDDAALDRISGYYREMKGRKTSPSYALANAYLYAKHALERNARILEMSKGQIENGSGMSDKEANDIIAFVNGMQPAQRKVMNDALAEFQLMIDKTNDEYIESGLILDYKNSPDIDDETKEAFEQYSFYVPLRGYADEERDLRKSSFVAGAGGAKYGVSGKPNKTPLGRSSYAGDIINNIGVQRQTAIDKGEKNKVGQAFVRLLQSDEVDTTGIGAEILERHPLRRVMRNGVISTMPDRDFDIDEDGGVLPVRINGEEVLVGFSDPRLANAFKGGSTSQSNAFLGGLHTLTRFYANLLTSWNPAFILSNLPRDIETAAFNAQQFGVKGISKDIMKGTRPAFKAVLKEVNGKEGGDPYWRNRYNQFRENGGANELNQMANEINNAKDIQKTINSIVTEDAKGNKAAVNKLWNGTKKGGGSILNYVEALNTAAENSIRLAFFDRMVLELEGQGVPTDRALKEAAVAARQLTTNFAKGGELKYGLNSLYLFFNASLQGSMAMFNSLINNKRGRQLVASVVAMGFTMDWLNAITSDDEDEDGILDYDDLGEYKLAHSIVLPDLNGDGVFVTIPMAYGINMFYNFGRSLANLTRGASGYNGTYTPVQAATSTLGTVTETINPFGGNNLLTFLLPTVGDMPAELLMNKNFMNDPIYKELSPYEQYKSRSGLYWSTTSPTAVGISKFINDYIGGGDESIPGTVLGMRVDIQPDVIEHITDFMLGGAGRFLVQTGESAARTPEIMMGEWEKDMVRRTPIVNKAFTAVTNKDRSGSFYEKRNDIMAIRSSLKDAVDDGDRDKIIKLREKYAAEIRLIKPMMEINKRITKLNKMKRAVQTNARISEQKRKEAIQRLEDQIAMLVSRGNVLMRDI